MFHVNLVSPESSVLSPAKTEAMFEAILLFGYAVVPLTGVFPEVFS